MIANAPKIFISAYQEGNSMARWDLQSQLLHQYSRRTLRTRNRRHPAPGREWMMAHPLRTKLKTLRYTDFQFNYATNLNSAKLLDRKAC